MTQWAPHGMGPVWKKAHIVLQLTIEEELEEEETGEVTEEVVVVGEPAVEVTVDEDTMMQDMPVVALVAEVGLSAEATRTMLRDAVEELLGIRSDGMIQGYLKPSLVEITWQNLQETHKLHESLDRWEKLDRMIICQLAVLVAQGCVMNTASMWGKGKQKAEESDSNSEEQII